MLLYRFCFVLLFRIWAIFFKYEAPGAYIRRGDLTEGFLRFEFGGLYSRSEAVIHGGLIFGILR